MERFWSKVDRSGGPDACWPWTACRFKNRDYGAFFYNGRLQGAHRVSWVLANGPVPDGLWVLHRCDNRPCVNPAHLWLGTAAENTADMMAKGRHSKGEQSPQAKLTKQSVNDIRNRYHRGLGVVLAREYGVSATTIRTIARGEVWL